MKSCMSITQTRFPACGSLGTIFEAPADRAILDSRQFRHTLMLVAQC
jgi:hypothetical protein